MQTSDRNVTSLPDYYWKDYRGDIPDDAVKGGCDEAGHVTYIGQGYFHGYGLVPGTIRKGCNACTKSLTTSAGGNVLKSKTHIKILCSTSPERMMWIRTSVNEVSTLTHEHIVTGGVFKDQILYIGKALHNLNITVGPVLLNGLSLPEEKNEVVKTNFEILAMRNNKLGSKREYGK